MKRPILIVLGILTAVQAGTGLWRIGVMYQEGLRFGARPWEWSGGLLEELVLSALLAITAWWWLPRGGFRWAAWAVHFLALAWTLAIGQMVWVYLAGFFEHGVSWALLLVLFLGGAVVRQRRAADDAPRPGLDRAWRHPALGGALAFWLLQLPHLFFPYHWTDTKDIWACRAVAFDATGGLQGIFDCLDPGRPPLHSVLLWLGHTNGTIEGRLLPFLLVGAFGFVLYRVLRLVAPTLAPWGVLWFFMTVRVYQGAVSNYADVPVMIAIAVGLFLATDPGLVASRWQAVAFAVVAGAAAELIKRDGGALIVIATAAIWWFLPRRRDPRLYAALLGAAAGFGLWSVRPPSLQVPAVFDVQIGALAAPAPTAPLAVQEAPAADPAADSTRITPGTYLTMFYGMQGQMLSHYGFGMFVPLWLILSLWLWRSREALGPDARLYTWIAVLGWLAIVGIYVVHVSTGHPYRGSLRIIRTAFGRHLVHMFVFALLSAVAIADVLVQRTRRLAR